MMIDVNHMTNTQFAFVLAFVCLLSKKVRNATTEYMFVPR